jgi:A/G-specific adenine glycosylase
MSKVQNPSFSSKLLAWYDNHARVLPWRDDPTPYRVLISEIMLQQTRVETVIPYFERFIIRLTDIFSLAKISDDELFKLWEGLGYYRRASNLKRTAQIIVDQYKGIVPNSVDALIQLPGIGAYTAGAISSIAYNQKATAIDGNVIRVISRITGNKKNTTTSEVKKEIEKFVWNRLPMNRFGDFTQAMMEVGAIICLPNGTPKCNECPFSDECYAFLHNQTDVIPLKTSKPKRLVEELTVFIYIYQNQIAIRKREEGLLSGLFELPNEQGKFTHAMCEEYCNSKGYRVSNIQMIGTSKHIFSHIEWKMNGFLVNLESDFSIEHWTWATKNDVLNKYSIPKAFSFYIDWFLLNR